MNDTDKLKMRIFQLVMQLNNATKARAPRADLIDSLKTELATRKASLKLLSPGNTVITAFGAE